MRADSVLLGERVLNVAVHVAVVAPTGDKHDPEIVETLHFLRQSSSAVHIIQIVQSPTHADDQPLAFLLCHVIHPAPSIDDLLV